MKAHLNTLDWGVLPWGPSASSGLQYNSSSEARVVASWPPDLDPVDLDPDPEGTKVTRPLEWRTSLEGLRGWWKIPLAPECFSSSRSTCAVLSVV